MQVGTEASEILLVAFVAVTFGSTLFDTDGPRPGAKLGPVF